MLTVAVSSVMNTTLDGLALLSVAVKDSVPSELLSSIVGTLTIWIVSPARNVTTVVNPV